jgi:alkylation response protein AidB-like acyl-CoA dehydrogenase
VDFELTGEQRLFRQTLRDFADKEIVPVAPEWERTGRYPAEIVERLAELGLFGLNVPEEYGGLAADRVSYALAFEEIARAWLGAAGLFGPHSVACWMVTRHGTPDQKQRYLPPMAGGELRSGIALTEPGAGTDLQGISTKAQQVLGGLEVGRINIAARAVGVAQAAFDAALGYSRDRQAFGKPIADFRAIQLKLADMATEIQAARLLTYWAAARSQTGGRVDMEAGMAKMYASEVALTCALESMRIHGGYGYSAEFIVERLYRDAPLMAIGEGTNDIQRLVIARSLVSGAGRLGW